MESAIGSYPPQCIPISTGAPGALTKKRCHRLAVAGIDGMFGAMMPLLHHPVAAHHHVVEALLRCAVQSREPAQGDQRLDLV